MAADEPPEDAPGGDEMTEATREGWARAFTAAARAHWTPARTRALTAGKALRILPAEAPLLLRALGLLHRDASMPPPQVRKFLQINHLVGALEASIAELRARHPVVRLLDAGCGRSYLTLLLAWCGRHVWRHPLEVLGVDRSEALVATCRRRTRLAGLDDVVRFAAAPLDGLDPGAAWAAAYGAPARVHGVVALHACDTATCDALALAVAADAELVAVAPCCQAEVARGWAALDAAGAAGPFAPVWGAPHLRREVAAHLTDAMRAALLRAAGYQVTALEFVGGEHTAKNTLLRARRAPAPAPRHDPAAWAAYEALRAATGGVGLALAGRLAAVGPGPAP